MNKKQKLKLNQIKHMTVFPAKRELHDERSESCRQGKQMIPFDYHEMLQRKRSSSNINRIITRYLDGDSEDLAPSVASEDATRLMEE